MFLHSVCRAPVGRRCCGKALMQCSVVESELIKNAQKRRPPERRHREKNILQATSPHRFIVPARGAAYAKIMLKQ
jgi:hypothetical protein